MMGICPDFVDSEALRQVGPDVYEALRRYKKFLTEADSIDFLRKDEAVKEREKEWEQLVRFATEDRKELVRELIWLIFGMKYRIR